MALSELLEGMPMTAGNWSEVVESTATVDSTDVIILQSFLSSFLFYNNPL